MTDNEESVRLYVLFCMHAKGERLVEHTCPNCGSMPHVRKLADGSRVTYTCMQCQCVTSTTNQKESHE
jgi:predicted RNA-binding Zn-ribbon protein involved in translation (DUF1610 family)